MPATFTDPSIHGTLTLQQLYDDLTYLNAMYMTWAAANPDLTNLAPSFAVDPTGTKLVVTLNGQVVATLPLPAQADAFKGNYTPGVSYVVGNTFACQGSIYATTTPFTATNFAADAANYAVQQQGVVLPLPSSQVQDVTNNTTLDKTIVGLGTTLGKINASITALQAAIAALQTAVTKDANNVAAINAKLGQDGIAGFPLTLQ